jgi:condensin complex subunit 1
MDPKDIARDSSGTRCVASFLVEVAEKIPLVMLPSISVLMCHLDEEVKEY